MPEAYYPLWLDGKKTGKITQQFGEYNPRYLQWGFDHHNGIDITERSGLAIRGMSGKVDVVGNDSGYGLYVSIKDEAQQCWWTYAHMSHIEVKHNQTVLTGDIIGRVGNTGNSTGPHVHVECKPFDYQAHKDNGTLGRVDFNWFLSIIVEEEMNASEYRAVQNRIEYLKAFKYSKGLWLKNDNGTYREMNQDNREIRAFSTPEQLFEAGWQFEDAV